MVQTKYLVLLLCLIISTQCSKLRQTPPTQGPNQPITDQANAVINAATQEKKDQQAQPSGAKVAEEAIPAQQIPIEEGDQTEINRVFGFIPIIKITGKAVGSAPTDLVKVQIEVQTKDLSAINSLKANNDNSNLAITALNKMNIANNDIETTDFSITPQYDYKYNYETSQNDSIFTGYQASNKLRITTKDLSQAAQIIDAAVKSAKGININSVDFSISPEVRKKMEDSLIQAAISDARNKAEIALDGTGYRIKGIKSIDLDSSTAVPIEPVPMSNKAALASDANVVLFGNQQDITMQADVVFFIEKFQ